MGRKRNCVSRNFFNFHKERNVSECKFCKATFKGNYVCNLKRHLVEQHKKEYTNELAEENTEVPEKKVKFTVTMCPSEVKDACVDLVTTQKMPFSVLNSDSFKILTTQIFNGLQMPVVTSRNVMSLVDEKYDKIKSEIVASLTNRMICLKMDTATRLNRGILGINVQYYNGSDICVRTLGLIELQKSHTSENLCANVQNILSDFHIRKEQIYAITTDNGRNMIKAVELLSDCLGSEDATDGSNSSDENLDDEALLKEAKIFSISSIKCAAHTLQLAAKDFLKHVESDEYIEKARKIIKILRTPSYRFLIMAKSLPRQELDVPTRWNSTFTMLNTLLKFEEFCDEHVSSPIKLTSSDWDEIKTLVSILEPVNCATLKLQSTQLYMGDFYKLWLELKLAVGATKYFQSPILHQCIQNRERALMENHVVVCSIYLDPRIRRVLQQTPLTLMLARVHLKQLMLRIYNVDQKINHVSTPCIGNSQPSTSSQAENTDSHASNTCSLLNEFLNSIEVVSDDDESSQCGKSVFCPPIDIIGSEEQPVFGVFREANICKIECK